MKKVDAYTLMEVTIAMLLSAICITICYSAYGIVNNYYSTFQKKNELADRVLSLRHALETDFLKGNYILKNEEGFEVALDSATINYCFYPNAILRKVNELHTDTFKVDPKELTGYFEGNLALNTDTIDQIGFKIKLSKGVTVPIQLNKLYSAQNLFN